MPRAESTDRWPVFLPDGRRFLFTRATGGFNAAASDGVAYLATLDGGEPARIGDGSWRLVIPAAGGRDAYLVGVAAAGVVAQAFDFDTLAAKGSAVTLAAAATAVSGSTNGVLATSIAGTRPKTVRPGSAATGTGLASLARAALSTVLRCLVMVANWQCLRQTKERLGSCRTSACRTSRRARAPSSRSAPRTKRRQSGRQMRNRLPIRPYGAASVRCFDNRLTYGQ